MKMNWNVRRMLSGGLALLLSVTLLSGCSEIKDAVIGARDDESEKRGKHKKRIQLHRYL